jgi:hypothetical protein
MPYFSLETIKQHNLDRAAVETVAAEAAAHTPHIARVYTRRQLMSSTVPPDDISRALSVGFYGGRSGDLIVLQEPYYLFDATGTSIKSGIYARRTAVNDITATLAQFWESPKPSGRPAGCWTRFCNSYPQYSSPGARFFFRKSGFSSSPSPGAVGTFNIPLRTSGAEPAAMPSM